MNSDEHEKAFSDFIDEELYDKAEEWLFHFVCAAFDAGWDAVKRDNLKVVEE